MLDTVVGLLEADINWNNILLIVIGYIFLLWFLLSFWVALDAKRRYKSIVIAIFLFLVVLILNIPALVFYLIVRPEREEDNILYLHSEESGLAGVNVPVVNFKGDDGFVISLQLKIGNPSATKTNNMNIDVNFESDDLNMSKEEPKIEQIEVVDAVTPSGANFINAKGFIKNKSAGLLNAARKVKSKFNRQSVVTEESASSEPTEISTSESSDKKNNQGSNKNNHKHNHKKKKHRR